MEYLIEKAEILKKSANLDFDACGIARAGELLRERDLLKSWLSDGMHGEMKWMENHVAMRTDPQLLLPGAKSVIVFLLNYFPVRMQEDPEAPVYSKYAYGKDYHKILKKKLKLFIHWLHQQIPGSVSRAFVDSAPVLERTWAVRAGLGWTGKNSLLITRNQGSFLFIGEVITTASLEPDIPFDGDYCGSCTRCLDNCPTQAIIAPGVVDARKCLSYKTIEYKGPLNDSLHQRVYGCDICQDVCPWNKLSLPHKTPEFHPAPGLIEMKREDWISLTNERYSELFRGTPADRQGFEGLTRNIEQIRKFTDKEL